MANWFVPFRQLQRREALVGQRVNERTNQSRPHSLTCANLTYVNIQFTQPTSTSHLLNLASCFVSLPLSVSLFFWLPQDLSHVSASSALDLFLFLWLSCDGDPMCFVFARNSQDNFPSAYIYIRRVLCAWCQDAGFTVFSTVWFCSCFRRLQDILFFSLYPSRWLDQERCLASCSLSMVITVVTAYIW